MAKKSKGGQNKSQAIREYNAANPSASPKEVAEALSKTGMTVTAQFVSTVLSNARRKGGKVSKRGRKPGRPAAAKSGDLQQLIQAKKLVDQLGGVEAARAAVNVLAKLLGYHRDTAAKQTALCGGAESYAVRSYVATSASLRDASTYRACAPSHGNPKHAMQTVAAVRAGKELKITSEVIPVDQISDKQESCDVQLDIRCSKGGSSRFWVVYTRAAKGGKVVRFASDHVVPGSEFTGGPSPRLDCATQLLFRKGVSAHDPYTSPLLLVPPLPAVRTSRSTSRSREPI